MAKYRQTPEEYWALHNKRFERAVSRYATSCMSNIKWKRVIDLLSDQSDLFDKVVWRFVYEDSAPQESNRLPDPEFAAYGDWDFYPLSLRDVESVEFVSVVPDKIEALLCSDAKYSLERTDNGVRLNAYLF